MKSTAFANINQQAALILILELVFGITTYELLLQPIEGRIWLWAISWVALTISGLVYLSNLLLAFNLFKRTSTLHPLAVILTCFNTCFLPVLGLYYWLQITSPQ